MLKHNRPTSHYSLRVIRAQLENFYFVGDDDTPIYEPTYDKLLEISRIGFDIDTRQKLELLSRFFGPELGPIRDLARETDDATYNASIGPAIYSKHLPPRKPRNVGQDPAPEESLTSSPEPTGPIDPAYTQELAPEHLYKMPDRPDDTPAPRPKADDTQKPPQLQLKMSRIATLHSDVRSLVSLLERTGFDIKSPISVISLMEILAASPRAPDQVRFIANKATDILWPDRGLPDEKAMSVALKDIRSEPAHGMAEQYIDDAYVAPSTSQDGSTKYSVKTMATDATLASYDDEAMAMKRAKDINDTFEKYPITRELALALSALTQFSIRINSQEDVESIFRLHRNSKYAQYLSKIPMFSLRQILLKFRAEGSVSPSMIMGMGSKKRDPTIVRPGLDDAAAVQQAKAKEEKAAAEKRRRQEMIFKVMEENPGLGTTEAAALARKMLDEETASGVRPAPKIAPEPITPKEVPIGNIRDLKIGEEYFTWIKQHEESGWKQIRIDSTQVETSLGKKDVRRLIDGDELALSPGEFNKAMQTTSDPYAAKLDDDAMHALVDAYASKKLRAIETKYYADKPRAPEYYSRLLEGYAVENVAPVDTDDDEVVSKMPVK
jgi:hypothetical protein